MTYSGQTEDYMEVKEIVVVLITETENLPRCRGTPVGCCSYRFLTKIIEVMCL
jgi:hypothetical protein